MGDVCGLRNTHRKSKKIGAATMQPYIFSAEIIAPAAGTYSKIFYIPNELKYRLDNIQINFFSTDKNPEIEVSKISDSFIFGAKLLSNFVCSITPADFADGNNLQAAKQKEPEIQNFKPEIIVGGDGVEIKIKTTAAGIYKMAVLGYRGDFELEQIVKGYI